MTIRILGLVLLCVSSATYAQLAQNLTVGSAKALALGNAVTADPPGIDAIHFNPAGLYQVKGNQYQLKVIAGQFTIRGDVERSDRYKQLMDQFSYDDDADPVAEGVSSTSDVAVMLPFFGMTDIPLLAAPLGGASVEMNSGQYVLGSAVFAPMVVGYQRGDDSPLRYQGNELGLTHLTYFSPTIAFPLSEELTFGIGLHFNYTGVGIDLDFRLPNAILVGVDNLSDLLCQYPELAEVVNLCEGDLGPFTEIGNIQVEVENHLNPSFNLGLLWEPYQWLSVGMVYQSGASKTLKGEYKISYGEDWLGYFSGFNGTVVGNAVTGLLALPRGVAMDEGEAALEFTVPQHFAVGVSVDVTPDWKLNADLKWTDTAKWDEFKLEFETPPDFLPILSVLAPDQVSNTTLAFPREYQSVWSWALGLEHRYNERLALRLGYEDRGNSIPADKVDYMAPFGDAYLLGAGFAYVPTRHALLEVAVGMLVSESAAADNSSTNVNDHSQLIYNPYAGVNVKTEVRAYLLEISYRAHF